MVMLAFALIISLVLQLPSLEMCAQACNRAGAVSNVAETSPFYLVVGGKQYHNESAE